MDRTVETKLPPEAIWQAWERAYSISSVQGSSEWRSAPKERGKGQFRYQIFAVKPGISFSLLWKSLFAHLIFSYTVKPSFQGASISFDFQIKGPLAWPLRLVLKKKIQRSLLEVLKSMVKQLEQAS